MAGTKAVENDGEGFPGDENYSHNSDWLGDDYEVAYEDSGEKINFEALPNGTFEGVYIGYEVKPDVESLSGETKDVTLYKFKGRDGERYCAFGNFAIEQALAATKDTWVNRKIRMVHRGKTDIGNGQTMNRIDVFVSAK